MTQSLPAATASCMPAMTKGEPTRVRMTVKVPAVSMPEFEVTGVTTTSGAEELRGDQPQEIAAQRHAGLVGHQRPVAIAIGGNDRVEAVLLRPSPSGADRLFGDGFGIDRE